MGGYKQASKKAYEHLIDTIECNTEAQWQNDAIVKALLEYLTAIGHKPEYFRYGI